MKKILTLFLVGFTCNLFAQPFADIANFSVQHFSAKYKDHTQDQNRTDDFFLNFFLPKEFKNGNMLLVRLNGEMIRSEIVSDSAYSKRLYSAALPLGFQYVSKNKKWKTVAIFAPKLASDFQDRLDIHDFQYGGILLENYVVNDKLKIKLGAYCNKEAYGYLLTPLVGVDWQINDRINIYGLLPSNYRAEYSIVKNKLFTGLCFKSVTRSFRLSEKQHNDYVRYQETQLKLFLDYFLYKQILIFGEFGYTLGKNPLEYQYNSKTAVSYNPVYTAVKRYPTFQLGLAYRVRK